MNFSIIVILLITSTFIYSNAVPRNWLWNEFMSKNGTASLNYIDQWRMEFKSDIQKSLEDFPVSLKEKLIKKATEENATSWPSLTASDFLLFVKTGDRTIYETSILRRRTKLAHLIIGELLTNRSGKFLSQIVNGVWLILEESSWIAPAHLGFQKAGTGLPDPEEPVIDLIVAECGALISYVRFLLGDQLGAYAPKKMIIKRIDYEINRRIIQPFLSRNFSWSLQGGNWNIWINTNLLQTALLSVDNVTIRNKMIVKTIWSADIFLNGYPDDGGCDEGPIYWDLAGGRFIQYIDLLNKVSNNSLSWSSYQMIQRMGQYIAKMHIDKTYFADYGDAQAILLPDPFRVFKFGQIFNDQMMKQFGVYLLTFKDLYGDEDLVDPGDANGLVQNFANELVMRLKTKDIDPKAPHLKESWMKNLQIINVRSKEDSSEGLFLSAKAGYNNERHGHNNVGNFILYLNGEPGIIDVGVGVYSADTFNKNRYKLWYMQSQWHNLPTINGVLQHNGAQYKSRQVSYLKTSENTYRFQLDMALAYPKEAAAISWIRTYDFDGDARTLNINDSFRLSACKNQTKLHFITIMHDIQHTESGLILKKDSQTLAMKFDHDVLDVVIEQKATDDKKLRHAWGSHVTRVSLVSKLKEPDCLAGQFRVLLQMM